MMRRRDQGLSRKERERLQGEIDAAGGLLAWIGASKSSADEVRDHNAQLNAVAKQCGMAPPYPEIDTSPPPDRDP